MFHVEQILTKNKVMIRRTIMYVHDKVSMVLDDFFVHEIVVV